MKKRWGRPASTAVVAQKSIRDTRSLSEPPAEPLALRNDQKRTGNEARHPEVANRRYTPRRWSNAEAQGRQFMGGGWFTGRAQGVRTESLRPCACCRGECPRVAQAAAQPISQQMEQQRRAQAELHEALEQSERRIAAAQAEQIRKAQERAEQHRRAQAEADRRREAEQRKEEFLAQARAQGQESNPPQSQDAMEARR
jgi:hypothetical protein